MGKTWEVFRLELNSKYKERNRKFWNKIKSMVLKDDSKLMTNQDDILKT